MAIGFNYPMTFTTGGWVSPEPPTPEQQNKKLRDISVDSLIGELDSISVDATTRAAGLTELASRASRAAGRLRALKPLFPAGQAGNGKRRKR